MKVILGHEQISPQMLNLAAPAQGLLDEVIAADIEGREAPVEWEPCDGDEDDYDYEAYDDDYEDW